MRLRLASLVFALCLPFSINAQSTDEQPLSRKVGRELAEQVIFHVEKDGLAPRSIERYQDRKRLIFELLAGEEETIDRKQLYSRLRSFLNTLDTDGHTFLSSRSETSQHIALTSAQASSAPELLELIATPAGKVLVFTPPQITGWSDERQMTYTSAGLRNMRSSSLPTQSCALLIDLGEQKGGNAWPVMDLLSPLLTEANTARFVNRSSVATPIFSVRVLQDRRARLAEGLPNPLERFKGQPLTFVQYEQTASAGEMVAILLLGQGARSFGWASHGATTANIVVALPDDATLALTTDRYRVGDNPVIRGVLQPDDPARAGEDAKAVRLRAATWAAQQSSRCGS